MDEDTVNSVGRHPKPSPWEDVLYVGTMIVRRRSSRFVKEVGCCRGAVALRPRQRVVFWGRACRPCRPGRCPAALRCARRSREWGGIGTIGMEIRVSRPLLKGSPPSPALCASGKESGAGTQCTAGAGARPCAVRLAVGESSRSGRLRSAQTQPSRTAPLPRPPRAGTKASLLES